MNEELYAGKQAEVGILAREREREKMRSHLSKNWRYPVIVMMVMRMTLLACPILFANGASTILHPFILNVIGCLNALLCHGGILCITMPYAVPLCSRFLLALLLVKELKLK